MNFNKWLYNSYNSSSDFEDPFDKTFNNWLHFGGNATIKSKNKKTFNRWLYGTFEEFDNVKAQTQTQTQTQNGGTGCGGVCTVGGGADDTQKEDEQWYFKGNKFIDMRNYFPILKLFQ